MTDDPAAPLVRVTPTAFAAGTGSPVKWDIFADGDAVGRVERIDTNTYRGWLTQLVNPGPTVYRLTRDDVVATLVARHLE